MQMQFGLIGILASLVVMAGLCLMLWMNVVNDKRNNMLSHPPFVGATARLAESLMEVSRATAHWISTISVMARGPNYPC